VLGYSLPLATCHLVTGLCYLLLRRPPKGQNHWNNFQIRMEPALDI